MSVSPEHEALHRIFQHDPALFARAVARTLDVEVTEPRRMSELNVDLTETRPSNDGPIRCCEPNSWSKTPEATTS